MKVILALLLMFSESWAQVNIESFRSEDKLNGDVMLSLSSNIGNVDAIQGDGAGNITLHTDAAVYLAVVKGGMGFLGGRRFANSGVAHLRYSLKRSHVWQPEFFVQADYAKSRRLDGRFLAGGGMRWVLSDENSVHAAVGSALMWEHEAIDTQIGDSHPSRTSQLRCSNYVNMKINGRATFSTTVYYQFAVSSWKDIRLLGSGELSTPILGNIKQTTTLNFRIDSKPPMAVKTSDIKLATSFGISF